jgi:predicted Zn-dependent protease
MPQSIEADMGQQVLASLNNTMLTSSELTEDERDEILARFKAMATKVAPDTPVGLVFRKSYVGNGINAITLPGGTIVLFDGLVNFADDKDAVQGVLAHELAHARYHHMTKRVFQGLGTAALAGLIWGDYSSVATNTFAVIGVLKYSRDDEREADKFAYAAMETMQLDPQALSRFLEKIDKQCRDCNSGFSWLNTHPQTGERTLHRNGEKSGDNE